jgi:hypothetical protein
MPIKMMQTESGAGPIVVCDQCGKRIDDASEASYIWNESSYEPGSLHDVYFVHSRCDEALQRQVGEMPNSQSLIILMPYLVSNLNVDWDEAKKYAELNSEEIG